MEYKKSRINFRLAIRGQQLEEEEAMLTLFNKRYNQFMQWADDFESRLKDSQVNLFTTILYLQKWLLQSNLP